MRICYLSDLHLEHYKYEMAFPKGDLLLLAGDICRAVDLVDWKNNAERTKHRDHVLWFFDEITEKFRHVLYCAGNHEHFDFDFFETHQALRSELPDTIHVLDKDYIEIENTIFYGATLWSDFEGNYSGAMACAQEKMPEYKYVTAGAKQLTPEVTLRDHYLALRNLSYTSKRFQNQPLVVLTHHSPSFKGQNNAVYNPSLRGAFATDLEEYIAKHSNILHWVFGHTHVQTSFEIEQCKVMANCRGYKEIETQALQFNPDTYFDLSFSMPENRALTS